MDCPVTPLKKRSPPRRKTIELLIEYLVHGMMKIHEILDFLIFRIFQNLMILYLKVRNIGEMGLMVKRLS